MNNRTIRFRFVFFTLIFGVTFLCAEPQDHTEQGWFPITWQALKSAPSRMKAAFKDGVKKRFPKLWSSLHSASVAHVESSNAVSAGEKQAITQRMKHVTNAVQSKLGEIKKTPKIAIVASGGGLRASLATLGALSGLEKSGILDAVLWQSTLSGSTWAVGSWVQSALYKESLSATQYAQHFVSRIADRYATSMSRLEAGDISSLLLVNVAYDMPVTLVDLFGGMLSNVLFGNQTEKLSSQVAAMNTGAMPIPIYTAVSADQNIPHYWYAYTPWDVAIEPALKGANGFSIPSWALGREFLNKKSIGYKPEKTLGFNFGTFGSAFAADLKTLYKHTRFVGVENSLARSIIDSMINRYGTSRFTSAQVFNFTKGMKHSPFKDADTLKMVDAALDFNLPYPPVSGMRKDRSPDILIFIDASGNVATSSQLKKVEKYARAKKLKFPRISYKGIAQRAVSIFRNEKDLSVPTVIYIPLVKDTELISQKQKEFPEMKELLSLDLSACCGTTKGIAPRSGQYTAALAHQIITLMDCNVGAHTQEIWQEIAAKAGTPGWYEKAISLFEYGKKKATQARQSLGKFGI